LVREAAEIDMRIKRMTERQQQSADRDSALDFGLIQSRLSRSLRLSVAMAERIRADYLMRKEGRVASGEQERRRRRREQAAETVARAAAKPEEGWTVEYLRSVVRERLFEDEILDAQLDALSPQEFVQAVCRKIGRPPPGIPLPRSWDETTAPQAEPAEAADHERAEGRARPLDASGAGLPAPEPLQPDSS
jgi:hypothetical protein